MNVATGQFAVCPDWATNLQCCRQLMALAVNEGASLLVLPEAVLARDNGDPGYAARQAQQPDGPFLSGIREASLCYPELATVFTMHVQIADGQVTNRLFVVQGGGILCQYDKLHLYDAFAMQESRLVTAGHLIPPLFSLGDMRVGVMTCYDLRFPDLAMSLALAGADILVVPAAWVKGPAKEHHWATLLAARALDTTCYVVASGECGERNTGLSRVIDPMGITIASAGESAGLVISQVSKQRIAAVRAQLPVLENRRFVPPVLNV